jgi:serine phosphatase RsbU (regulator of sigma subunit)
MSETRRQNEIMRRELKMAARYQQFLLPTVADLPGVQVAFHFQPCSGVGGDYFDFIRLSGGNLGFVVADVSGHGMASAMTASIVKALLPGYMEKFLSPAGPLTALNDDLLRLTQEDSFVTAFAAIYQPDSRQLSWALAGHPSPLFINGDGRVQPLNQDTFFLGSFDSNSPIVNYSDQIMEAAPGQRLVFYTDGLTEAPDPQGAMFGAERIAEILEAGRKKDIHAVRDDLWRELRSFVQGDFPDDVAIILVEF